MIDACAPCFIATGHHNEELPAELVGSKAAQLSRMARLGLRVPPAFVLPTTLCGPLNAADASASASVARFLAEGMAWLEQTTGRHFGGSRRPLLVSVRSGAAVSMPGMLQTLLNVGLSPRSVHGLIGMSGNPRLGFDCYRRLIQGYGEVVEDLPGDEFEQIVAGFLHAEGVASDRELDPEALERLAAAFAELVRRHCGHSLPEDPHEQLRQSVLAVYRSWNAPKAREYRRLKGLEHLAGTAVTVQAMVFGNAGPSSGAGVAFSRNPATGDASPYIDFMFDAQGEDVVSGRRTPSGPERFQALMPDAAHCLLDGLKILERATRDVQDVEFTVERGELYLLQSRSAKRAPLAALRIALALVREGVLDKGAALEQLAGLDKAALTMARFTDAAPVVALATAASPGVASGRIVFDPRRAEDFARRGDPLILVRPDTSTEDIVAFALAAGILTATGGRTAHAAVVARELGKPCLVGCHALAVAPDLRTARLGDLRLVEGDWISLDGDSGQISLGRRAMAFHVPPEFAELERWRAAEDATNGARAAAAPSGEGPDPATAIRDLPAAIL